MLCLAPIELVTDAERRLCRVLTSLGSGTTVLGGLAVFVPVVEGAMQRRQADAVVFLPETLAVVRAVAMGGRQAGELRPSGNGMWTVGGEVLRLSGGGANPTGQLRKAVQLVHATLEAGGLDPGTPPGLVAIDGSITAVRDRSAGGPVACSLDASDVLTGLRHCASLGAQADRRVWTTADVRAALGIFGLQGRGPSVEDLNNEGFLYSPYVLRRPLTVTEPAVAEPVRREARAAVSTAPRVAAGVTTMPGGSSSPVVRRPPSEPPAAVADQETTGSDIGLSGLFDDDPPPAAPARPRPAVSPPAAPRRRSTRQRRRRTPWLVLLAVLLLAGAAAAGVLYATSSGLDGDADNTAQQTSTGPEPTTPSQAPPTVEPQTQVVGDTTYTLLARQADTDCAANSYGQVAEYFGSAPCVGLTRGLFTLDLDGVPAIVSVSVVQLADEATAAEFRTLVDTDGTGNVSDLLRSGFVLEGAPDELRAGAYASELVGSTVRIIEVAWQDEANTGDDALLDGAADDALTLELPAA